MATVKQLRRDNEPRLALIAEEGFERALLSACFANMEAPGPLQFNNFAYALRELLRHVFHRLAPDADVRQCDWFKPDPKAKTGITRSHRVKYMIQGGLSDFYVTKILQVDVQATLSELAQAFEVLNSFTHIGPATFSIPRKKVEALATQCLNASTAIVRSVAECRSRILAGLSDDIDDHLLSEVLSETLNELDELATHHYIDEVFVDSSEILEIGPGSLTLAASGSVGVELQYGSSSDIRNDIGAVVSDSFPFSAELHVRFERPIGKHAKVRKFKVDTDSWYE
jgi:hypothetical protein